MKTTLSRMGETWDMVAKRVYGDEHFMDVLIAANISLRSIGIDSHDGLFSGNLTIMVEDTGHLETLVKKLRTVKGVKQVTRN